MAGPRPQPQDHAGVVRELQRLRRQLADLETAMAALTPDVTSDDVSNESGVAGATVTEALDQLDADIGAITPYTDEQAQDAVGGMVADTATIDLTYTDATPELKADVKAGSLSGTHWGGSTLTRWVTDAPPVSAHACDDEFPGSSLDAKWTEFDHPSILTPVVSNGRLVMTIATGTERQVGIYQTIPASEFRVTTRCGLAGLQANFFAGGIMLMQGTTNTSDLYLLKHYQGTSANGCNVAAQGWLDYQTLSFNDTNEGHGETEVWLRLLVNGTTITAQWSSTGEAWRTMVTRALGFTPAQFGLFVDNSSGANITAYFDFFRVVSGAGSSAPADTVRDGREVTLLTT